MPFWVVEVMAVVIWVCEIVLGIDFSSQNKSSNRKARFWLMVRFW